MKFTMEQFMEDLERLVSVGERRERIKVPHKFFKARLSEKKPIISIDKQDYSAWELLDAIKRGNPFVKEIVVGGIDELNRILGFGSGTEDFESDISGTEEKEGKKEGSGTSGTEEDEKKEEKK